MTEQELEDIKERLLQNKYLLPDQYKNIMSALEKQIPKKPLNISKVKDANTYIGNIGICPCCKEIIDDDRFVCDCGQRLLWED